MRSWTVAAACPKQQRVGDRLCCTAPSFTITSSDHQTALDSLEMAEIALGIVPRVLGLCKYR